MWSNIRGNLPTYGWSDRETEVNDNGEVVSRVYNGPNGNTYDIYTTDRGAITDDDIWQDNPDINNLGEIVWEQNDEIWSDIRGKVGDGTNPAINDLGEIVWSYSGDIYSSIRGQLTFDNNADEHPQIANNGDVAFIRTNYPPPSPVPIPSSFWLFASSIFVIRYWRDQRNDA